MIQLTDHIKFNRNNGPTKNTLIPYRRGKNKITRGRGRVDEGQGNGKGRQDKIWEKTREKPSGKRRINRNIQVWVVGEGGNL